MRSLFEILDFKMDERNRLPPVTLSAKEPVAELVVRFLLPEAFGFGFLGELFTGFRGSESGEFCRII